MHAPTVVVSAGAIRTPCLLKKSDIEDSLIGKNLRVHPVAFSVGFFDKKNTMPWEGAVMTALVTKYGEETRDPHYGAKIINMPLRQGSQASICPGMTQRSGKPVCYG